MSYTIYNQKIHFVSVITPLPHQCLKFISVNVTINWQGISKWNLEDENVQLNTLEIKDALYVPDSLISILCPQHWDQKSNDNFQTICGTYMENYVDYFNLYYIQSKYQRSIKWDPNTNSGCFQ